MLKLLVLALALALVCAAVIVDAQSDEAWLNSKVAHLSAEGDNSLDSFVAANPSTLIMFYAPWCGHCKNMKPAYAEAASKITDGRLAAVDCTQNAALCGKYSVRGYPTIKYFKDGADAFKYEKGRSTADFVAFMANPTTTAAAPPPPPAAEAFGPDGHQVAILGDSNFTSYLSSHPRTLVMFYAPWCGHCKRAKPDYVDAAAAVSQANTGSLGAVDCTIAKATCSKIGVRGYPTIKYYRNGEEAAEDYKGARSKAAFIEYLDRQSKIVTEAAAAAAPAETAAAAPPAAAAKHEDL